MLDDSANPGNSATDAAAGRGAAILAAVTLAATLAVINLVFNPSAVLGLAILTIVALVAFPGAVPPRWVATGAALLSAVILAVRPPVTDVIRTPWLDAGILAGLIAAGSVALFPWLPHRRRIAGLSAALVLIALSYALTILGGRPVIDVWIILRDSAMGLLDGRNPYAMTFPDVPPGQTDSCFNYLPATFLLTAPGQWILGDVRWLESAYLFAAVALLCRQAARDGRRDGGAVATALLVGVMPGTLYIVQQSWNEPILLLGLVAGAVLIDRGRPSWAIVPLALALATKQHLIVLLPLLAFWPAFGCRRVIATGVLAGAICLPWFLAEPSRFYACTVAFYLATPALARSVSAWQLVPGPFRMPAVLAALALAYLLAIWRAPRTGGGFLMGVGVILMAFSLMNKQTFLNQWVFSAELVIAGLALAGTRPPAATLH